MEKSDFTFEIVPWFSQEEWLEVYKNIFGNKLEDWKRAYNQISVWRARVTRLPIGVEGTLPLLHAKIAQEEHFLDDAFRQSTLNLGILKFVSIATEGYEYRHLVGHALHNAATKINLPPYLIDIRNDIIHCDKVYGIQTLKSALDNCLQWIKTNYWEVEERNIKENKAFEMRQRRKRRGSDDENESAEDSVEIVSLRKFKSFIDEFVNNSLKTQSKHLAEEQLKRELPKLLTMIEDYLYCNPEECINVLVDDLFYHPFLRKQKNQAASKCKLHCKCRFNKSVIFTATKVLQYLLNFGLLDLFITQLVTKGKGYRRLRSGWLHMLANATFSDENGRCPKHRFLFSQNSLREAINWKEFLYQLFTLDEIWASKLAFKICDQNFAGIDADSSEVLKSLVSVYSKAEQPSQQSAEEAKSPKKIEISSNEVFDLNGVLQKAKMKLSNQRLEYVHGIFDLVDQTTEKGKDARKLPLSEMYLGVLPHQKGDPSFYQQLELPATELPNKRMHKQIRNENVA